MRWVEGSIIRGNIITDINYKTKRVEMRCLVCDRISSYGTQYLSDSKRQFIHCCSDYTPDDPEMSFNDIDRLLGWKSGTASKIYKAGMEKLKQLIDERGITP